jgi:hypothetical protein
VEFITNELINLLKFLLPGFVSIFLFYYPLTSFPKKSPFEMVVTALICTAFINIIMVPWGWLLTFVGEYWISFGEWEPIGREFWSFLIAVPIGLLVTYWRNNDSLNKKYRKFKITKQSSYPSEWYGTFSETISYIVLHFSDGRRLMGWPLEWPLSPKSGHFILEDASWLDDSGEIKLSNVIKIMVDTTSIVMVEFLNSSSEVKDE